MWREKEKIKLRRACTVPFFHCFISLLSRSSSSHLVIDCLLFRSFDFHFWTHLIVSRCLVNGTHIHTVVFALSGCVSSVSIVSIPSNIDFQLTNIVYENIRIRRSVGRHACYCQTAVEENVYFSCAHTAQNYVCVSVGYIKDVDRLSGVTQFCSSFLTYLWVTPLETITVNDESQLS